MRAPAIALLLCGLAAPALAQQDTTRLPTGVQLETRYTVQHKVGLAIRPFEAAPAIAGIATELREIIGRDLDFSDRFNLLPVPERLSAGSVEYGPWNSLNAVWLVTGALAPGPGGYRLEVVLHDVVYARIRERRTFALPATTAPGFRMAVHAISDEIIRWAIGQPGAAATQIVFTRQNPGGSSDLLIVNADGENLRRLAGSAQTIYSPAWSTDGRRLLYSTIGEGAEAHELIERQLASGATRIVYRAGLILTPAYSRDGNRLVFGLGSGSGALLHEYDLARRCCLRRLTSPAPGRIDMSPAISPQGDRIAFLSNRLGSPHIFVMNADGGAPTAVSPFVPGERAEFHAPDWSPTSLQIVFHGRSRGRYQIMLADIARPGAPVQQLTAEGQNEDPSWAPDGRHVVFTAREGLRGGPPGLYVIDTVTGRTRLLVRGTRLRMAAWSPQLMSASELIAAGQ